VNLKINDIVCGDKIYKDLTLHFARHTFATIWLNKTKDVLAIQKLLRHGDIKPTMIYVHITAGSRNTKTKYNTKLNR